MTPIEDDEENPLEIPMGNLEEESDEEEAFEQEGAISPLKAIRQKCLDCVCGSPKEVKLCTCGDTKDPLNQACTLFPFRFGHNPFRKKRENAGNADALKRWRESQSQ